MTLSTDDRRKNLNEALIAFINRLGDGWFSDFRITPTDYPDVLKTTWPELTNRSFLEDKNENVTSYQFTPRGYITALKLSGRSNEQQFREGLGKLCGVLKDCVKDRNNFDFIVFQELVRKSGVSEAFAHNALDADLIGNIFGIIGADWAGENLVKVPPNFGLTPL
jgi:hypothetical protein